MLWTQRHVIRISDSVLCYNILYNTKKRLLFLYNIVQQILMYQRSIDNPLIQYDSQGTHATGISRMGIGWVLTSEL